MTSVRSDPAVDDDEMVSLWGLVIEGFVLTQSKIAGDIQRECDLPPAFFDILMRLLRTPGARMPMTRLAREAALSSGGFTKVADRMVKADLIRREPSASDRRVVHAVLTEHGAAVAARAREVCAQTLRRNVLAPLGAERAEALAETMRALRAAHQGG